MRIFSSLKVRLLILVFIAITPAFILLLYGAISSRNHEEAEIRDEALRLTKFASGNIEQVIEGARQILITISGLPAIQNYDSGACRDFLTDLNKRFPMYENISMANSNGDILCRSFPTKKQVNVADRPWFQRSVKSRGFSFGDYQIARSSGNPTIRAALPVIDKRGVLKGVVGISIDLKWFNRQLTRNEMPAKTSAIVIDRLGTVLARYPNPEKWLEKNVSDTNIVRTILAEKEGIIEGKGIEGVNRIFSFAPIKGTDNHMYICLGISTEIAFAEANRALRRNLIWLIIISIMAGIAAWLGSDFFVMRRMKALTRATNELSGGDLSTRVHVSNEKDEIGQLGQSFNNMAAALEHNIAERNKIIRQNELLLKSAGEGILGLDLNGTHTFVNPAATRMLGYDSDELLGKRSHTLWHHTKADGSQYPEQECPIYKVLKNGSVYNNVIDEVFWRKDNTSFQVSYTTTPIIDNGLIIGAVLNFRDISKQKAAEKAIEESEKKYRDIFEQSMDTIMTITPEGNILDINSAGINLFGYSSKEESFALNIGTDLYANFEDGDRMRSMLDQYGFVKDYELILKQKGGEKINVMITATINYDERKKPVGYLAMLRDVTSQKKLEAQLRQSNKMEAIGALAGGVAHDFNNILTAIIGFGRMTIKRIIDDEKAKEYIEEMIAGANHAAELTRGLLAFSRKQVILPKPQDLNNIVINMGKMLRRIIGEYIELKTILSEINITVMVDASQIDQILLNLAANARDAMPDGGHLIIETDVASIDESYAEAHSFEHTGNYGVLTVSDTGIGMDLKTRENIFEPFFTTKDVGKGTGLGLAMVYGIVKQHGGNIIVNSEPGKGAIFRIYLPMEPVKVKTEEIENPAISVPQGRGETILVADDDDRVRKILRITLQENGYGVVEAVDGEDAVSKFKENADKVSVLILDVIMPLKNGNAVYEEINKLWPEKRVIFMSGYTDDIIAKKLVIQKGFEFISKPVDSDTLLSKIREVLDKKHTYHNNKS